MATSDNNAEFVEQAAVVDDIRVAEEQVARGEFIEHDCAKRKVLSRLGL